MLDRRCQSESSRLHQPEPRESARCAGAAYRRQEGQARPSPPPVASSVLDPLASGCFSHRHILGILRGLQEVSDMQTHTRWINGCWKSLLTLIPRVLLAVLKCYRSSCQRLRSGLQGWPRPQEYPASSLLFRHSCAVLFSFYKVLLESERASKSEIHEWRVHKTPAGFRSEEPGGWIQDAGGGSRAPLRTRLLISHHTSNTQTPVGRLHGPDWIQIPGLDP